MVRKLVLPLVAGISLAVCGTASAQEAVEAGVGPVPQAIPPLTYNYYYPPGGAEPYPARLYLAPRPIPEYVGYTWISYGPMGPHEWMWRFRTRRYYRDHMDGGSTITTIRWY